MEEPFLQLNITKAPLLGLAHPAGERHRQALSLLLLAMALGLWPTAIALLDSLKWPGCACHTSAPHTEPQKGLRESSCLLSPLAQKLRCFLRGQLGLVCSRGWRFWREDSHPPAGYVQIPRHSPQLPSACGWPALCPQPGQSPEHFHSLS